MLKKIGTPALGMMVGLVLTSGWARPAVASQADEVMTVVKAYLADMNSGDATKFMQLCAAQTVIIDDFPPHVWQGANACGDWLTGLAAYDAKTGIAPQALTIGAPRRIGVDGNHAYVVLPAGYRYTRQGKPVDEAHSVWTIALEKTGDGWRVTGWAWSQG